jgi:hypothetical protein
MLNAPLIMAAVIVVSTGEDLFFEPPALPCIPSYHLTHTKSPFSEKR